MTCLLIAAAAMAHPQAQAATITVRNKNDAGPGSLRYAIAHAGDNDTIVFASKVRGTIALSSTLSISKPLEIAGPGGDLLTLDANYTHSVFYVDAPGSIAISGLTLARGGNGSVGGGILNRSNLTVKACTIRDCSAVGSPGPGSGGGIYNNDRASLTLLRCTFSGNGAAGGSTFGRFAAQSGSGGAIFNDVRATAILRNCTLTANSAQGGNGDPGCNPFICGGGASSASGYGGAIYNGGALLVEGCTITANAARGGGGGTAGGGIANSGAARVSNTILAANTTERAGPDGAGQFTSVGFNLLGVRSGAEGFDAKGDVAGTIAQPLDPKVGPLQDNGGPTFTMALLPQSAAIDRGLAGDLKTDQRGRRRPEDFVGIANAPGGDGSDIGAFEISRGGLLNMSTRARVLTSDEVLIVGFIVTTGKPKEVIARGIGPSLPFEHALADPNIQLFNGEGALLASNDNWKDAESSAEIGQTLPPRKQLESALYRMLDPGAYTLLLRGKEGATGIGLAEVYDLDSSVHSTLANISSRGFVGTGDDAMITGIIIGPDSSVNTRVVLRAIGPSLAQSGINNALFDPGMELRDANGTVLAANEDWQSDANATAIQELGLAPGNPSESAMLQSLPPGGYTVIPHGKNGGTGIGLLEAYDVGSDTTDGER